MKVRFYWEWLHFCLVTRRLRRLYYVNSCQCGAWPYTFGAAE